MYIIICLDLFTTIFISLALNNVTYNNFKKNKKSLLFSILAAFIFSIILSLRVIDKNHIGGNDALTMYNTYLRASNYSFFEYWPYNSYREFGYSLITWIFNKRNLPYEYLLFIQYLISFFLLINFLVKKKYRVDSFFSFGFLGLLVCYLIYEINLQRNCIAIFIAMNFYLLLEEKKYIKALVCILLGTQIHLSMIFLMPIILLLYLYNKGIVKLNIILLIIVVCSISIFILIPLSVKYIYFLQQYDRYFISHFNGINQPIIVISMMMILNLSTKMKEQYRMYYIILLYSVIVFPVSFFLSMSYRLLFYFIPILFFECGIFKDNCIPIYSLQYLIINTSRLLFMLYGYFMFYGNYYFTGGVYSFVFR